MLFEDTYKTIAGKAEGIYREKGSKFIALAFPVETEVQVKELLAEAKKNYHDARHHCYAYILGADKSCYKMNDDGEPSSTAGRPIYGQLRSKDVTNVLLVVVRYFGGTKLGVSGLINAYKAAAQDALNNSDIIEKAIEEHYSIAFKYEDMNKVMPLLKGNDITILSQSFDNKCVINFKVRQSMADSYLSKLRKVGSVQ
ncbi:MAG: YigZ family protein [Bacteroidales bacterium]|jgi:uncharacterized YigZ family protein|nr:YigZ family protein [Bacteroidales bacterium]